MTLCGYGAGFHRGVFTAGTHPRRGVGKRQENRPGGYLARGDSSCATKRATRGTSAGVVDGRPRRSSDAVASSTRPAPPASAWGLFTDAQVRIPAASTNATQSTGNTHERTD